ncbi:type III pantothenate kinase [Striga asiatica]|uniref:Type III pantothenate kinase n=1 Tax=Striga asiatica TaxID=4170 RepID=A0A5A7QB83_STRAF|nr:type III pantothenate kinase [Striga asiatica]
MEESERVVVFRSASDLSHSDYMGVGEFEVSKNLDSSGLDKLKVRRRLQTTTAHDPLVPRHSTDHVTQPPHPTTARDRPVPDDNRRRRPTKTIRLVTLNDRRPPPSLSRFTTVDHRTP